jgi:hypothetical protein
MRQRRKKIKRRKGPAPRGKHDPGQESAKNSRAHRNTAQQFNFNQRLRTDYFPLPGMNTGTGGVTL